MMSKNADNLLLRRAILHALPPGFLGALVMTFSFMVDTVLAGLFFDGTHIACIGIVMPLKLFICAVLDIFCNGCMVLLTKNLGRGNRQESARMFSFAIETTLILGVLCMAVAMIFAPNIVGILGARDAHTVEIASSYLRGLSPLFILGSLNMFFNRLLAVNGLHSQSVVTSLVSMGANVVFSLLLVRFTNLGIASLALGTALSTLPTVICIIIILKKNDALFRFSFIKLKMAKIANIIKLGFPQSGDMIANSVSSGIINNILINGIGTIAVATFTVTRSIFMLVLCAARAAERSSSPLFGLLYGARDRNGIYKVTKYSLLFGISGTGIWSLVIIILLPLCLMLYGVTPEKGLDPNVIRTGVIVMTAFFPIVFLNSLLTSLYQATEQAVKSALNSVVADSIIFPLLLSLLVPKISYMGIWLSYGLGYVVFYIGFWIVLSIKNKKLIYKVDDIFNLPQVLRENVPKIDISIKDRKDKIVGISVEIHDFLVQNGVLEKKAYAAALCLEEIAVEYAETTEVNANSGVFDIKLFVDEDKISINVRSAGKRYNPIDFEYDPETFKKIGVHMVKKIASQLDYNYIYKINAIDIIL